MAEITNTDTTIQTPPNAAPTATPDVSTQPQQPTSAFSRTDNLILEKLKNQSTPVSSSLPQEPTSNQIPVPEPAIAPTDVVAPVTAIPSAESSEPISIADVPAEQWANVTIDATPAAPVTQDQTAPDGEDAFDYSASGLTDDAPAWQKESYKRIKQDTSLSDEEKNQILSLPPSKWSYAKGWQKSSKTMGKFRDANVPMSDVVAVFDKESPERAVELRNFALNELVSDPVKAENYVKANPAQFSQLFSELLKAAPEYTESVLKQSGYNIVKSNPADSSSILNDLKNDPMWGVIQGTALEQALTDKLGQLQTPQVEGNNDAANKENVPVSAPDKELYQQVSTTYETVLNQTWKPQVQDGLRAVGITPPTADEYKANPAAAHLKNIVFQTALNGLDGVLPSWDSESYEFGSKDEGFKGLFEELSNTLDRKDFDTFTDNAPILNEFYYNFGQKRGKLLLIQNLYKLVDSMTKATPQTPTPAIPTVPQSNTLGNGHGAPERKTGFASDKIILGKQQ